MRLYPWKASMFIHAGFLFGGIMNREAFIEIKLVEEAKKIAKKYQNYHNYLELSYQRNKKRIQNADPKKIKVPEYWAKDKKFNPFYVIHHRRQIAKSLAKKLRSGEYRPNPPHIYQVPKADGGKRDVAVYQIPDSAVSNLLYNQLLEKNKHRFSSFSYAYRNDRNVHFAIQDIAIDLKYYPRTFISEFDFSDFFGSISHGYLFQQFAENGFFITEDEKNLIKKFLEIKDTGVPQGTSISLFLANLACWRLDKKLEQNGLKFARYADDTFIWSNDYSKICRSFEIIDEFSKTAGVSINFKKSKGISLLSRKELPSEFEKTKHFIEFLGYKISIGLVAIKDSAVRKIKKQISYLLYKNLIQPLKGPQLRAIVIPSNDFDPGLLTAIMEIRRYLYGNLTDDYLRGYLKGYHRRINFKGIMSFYPLISDEEQLKQIDGWLVSTIHRSLKLRANLLSSWNHNRYNQFPFNVERNELVSEFKKQRIYGKRLLEVPSFMRIYLAIKKGLITGGIERVMNPNSDLYNYTS